MPKRAAPLPLVPLQYTIDSSLAVEQSRRAIIAMVVSAVVTCAFILLRFGPGFSAAGFISLASAGLFAICCFAMGGYEVRCKGVLEPASHAGLPPEASVQQPATAPAAGLVTPLPAWLQPKQLHGKPNMLPCR